jgi:hypothetical protein
MIHVPSLKVELGIQVILMVLPQQSESCSIDDNEKDL